MLVLLYCISQSGLSPNTSMTGVAETPVTSSEIGGLTVFTSVAEDSSVWTTRGLRQSALEFHRVLSRVFESAAIIPFRFPTIFESHALLAKSLQDQASSYSSLLEKFKDFVQMEITISPGTPAGKPPSGTAYLKQKQEFLCQAQNFGSQVQAALASMVENGRRGEAKAAVREFMVVKREHVASFQRAAKKIVVPHGLTVRVTGPWPVSEFLELS